MKGQGRTENQGHRDKSLSTAKHSAAGRVQEVMLILTGPTNPRRPVLVKGRSEMGTPSAVTGTVCQNREEGVREWTTH